MTATRLNVDVLEIVSDFLTDIPDVLSFALVSPSMVHIAARRLLSMHPVLLTSEKIRKFHYFLFVDAPARTPHVRALRIDTGSCLSPLFAGRVELKDASLLLEILTSCPNIKHISVNDALTGFTSDSRIIRAIASLQGLHSLAIHKASDCGRSISGPIFLREIYTPLRALSLHGYNGEIRFWYRNPVDNFLPRLAPTLEKLELTQLVVGAEEIWPQTIDLTPSVHAMAQYPAVRLLFVGHLRGPPLLVCLQHLFPALDGTLSICWPASRFDRPDSHYRSDILAADIRAANGRAQGLRSGAWRKLDRIVCDPLMLYLLCLCCPIRHVLLDASVTPLQPFAADALRENPVSHLKLTFRQEAASALDGVFSPELAETLTHLTLLLTYELEEKWLDPKRTVRPPLWGDVLNATISSLRPLYKLTHLRVIVRSNARGCWYNHSEDPEAPIMLARAYAGAFCGSVFDFEGTAVSLACPLPYLQYIFLAANGFIPWTGMDCQWGPNDSERWHVSRAWRVAAPGTNERRLMELHEDVAETIIRKEELVLAKNDEVRVVIYGVCRKVP